DIEIGARQLREAEKVIQQIEGINPQYGLIPLMRAELELARENLAGAREYYEQAWSARPLDGTGEKLYRVLAQQKDAAAQTRHLAQWRERIPGSAAALQASAMFHQLRSENDQAIPFYERLLQAQPNNVVALNNLGWLYFEKNDPRALGLLENAV